MATSLSYIEFVIERLGGCGEISCRKMFGEYMVYIDGKPTMTVCDNTVYIKKLPELEGIMSGAPVGCPYEGAREHYMLDIEDRELTAAAAQVLARVLPPPKPRAAARAKRAAEQAKPNRRGPGSTESEQADGD